MLRIQDHASEGDNLVGIERLEDQTMYVWDEKAGVHFDPITGEIFTREWKITSAIVDHARPATGKEKALTQAQGEQLADIVWKYGHKQDLATITLRDRVIISSLI